MLREQHACELSALQARMRALEAEVDAAKVASSENAAAHLAEMEQLRALNLKVGYSCHTLSLVIVCVACSGSGLTLTHEHALVHTSRSRNLVT